MTYTIATLSISLCAFGAMACAGDFDPYEDIQQPRLLALAADLPDLGPGDTAEITALLTAPAASLRWSWCPLVGAADEGYPCLIPHDQLQAAVDDALGAGQVTVPAYDLGDSAAAQLAHTIPVEVWRGFCDILQSGNLPGPVEFPRCEDSFPVTVRLEVAFGADLITGVRDVNLLYDVGAAANANPVVTGAFVTDPDVDVRIALDQLGTATLRRDVNHGLELDLSEDQSETYQRAPRNGEAAQTVREVLRVSWFHEGGELDASATSFTNGSTTFDDARTNEWRTPRLDERSEGTSRLFVVIRDDRGGTSWLSAEVGLVQ